MGKVSNNGNKKGMVIAGINGDNTSGGNMVFTGNVTYEEKKKNPYEEDIKMCKDRIKRNREMVTDLEEELSNTPKIRFMRRKELQKDIDRLNKSLKADENLLKTLKSK